MNLASLHYAAVVAVLALGTAGCASTGNETLRSQDIATVNLNVIDGRTTRSDIQRLFGPPSQTSFASANNEIWTYRWVRTTPQAQNFIPIVGIFVGGADLQRKELVILFNEQYVVVRHSMMDVTQSVQRDYRSAPRPTYAPTQNVVPTPSQTTAPVPTAPPATAPASGS